MIRNPFRFYDVPPPPPTYFGGTLPEVMVSSDEVPYPYYNQLTPEERSFFNDEGSIGRGVRSIAMTGKRGQTYSDLSRVAKDAESFAAEMTGIPGSIRFAQDPVKKLKGAGRTIEATILGSSPFIASPYNQEDVADTFDALDAFGFATLAFAPLKTPLQQGIKSSGRYLPHWLRGYPRSLNTQPLASNNVDLRRLSNPRSIWDQLFNIKRPEQFLPTPLNAKDELARANADALAFSQSPYNRAKLQRFRQGQDFDVTNTEALFSNDPLARERFDKLMKDDPNFLNYKNIENWQGAAEGNYGAKNFGDMDDLATVNKGIPQSKIYDAAIHEMGHSRSVRLPATVEERAILDDAWKPLQEPDGSPVPFLEAEAVQGELRMMLGDKLGKRVYTQKDAGEIKKALEKMVANDHPYVHIRNINDFDIPKIIKSLNEIGLAGFAGGVVAPKLLKNDKKGKK